MFPRVVAIIFLIGLLSAVLTPAADDAAARQGHDVVDDPAVTGARRDRVERQGCQKPAGLRGM